MKRKNLNVIIQAIACGTITLNLAPHLHGQQFDNQLDGTFQEMSGQVLDPNDPMQSPGLTEMEIPGSAYYVGPDGERLTEENLYQGNGVIGVPQGAGQGTGERIISEAPIYDGKNVYPMGTFPSQEFGEQIISETTVDENGKTVEVPGTLEGNAALEPGDGMENGIPTDQIVRPNLDEIATDNVQPPVPDGDAKEFLAPNSDAPGESVVAPDSLQQDMDDANAALSNLEAKANEEDSNNAQLKNLQSQLGKLNTRHDRLKDRLSQANRSIEKLTQEKQKAEKTAKDAAASMGEILAGMEDRSRKAKERSEEQLKAEALAKTKADAEENALKKELAETKKLLVSANEKLAKPKTIDKATAGKLAALLAAKESADAGLAKLKKDSGSATSRLQKQIKGLRAQLKRAESKVKDKKGKSAKVIQELEKDLKSAKSKADKAAKALADAKKKTNEVEKGLASKAKAMDSKLHKMESMMKEKLDAKDKAIGEKEKAIAEKENAIIEKVKQLDQKEEKISALSKKLDVTEKEFKAAEKEMAEASKIVEKSTEEMSAELKASQTKLKTLEKEVEEKIAAAGRKATNLESKLEQANKEATEANKAADEAKAALAKLQSVSKGEVRIVIDPDTGQLTLLGDPADTAIVQKAFSTTDFNPHQQKDAETDSGDTSDATGIAATPDPSPEPADGSAPKIDITSPDAEANSERQKRDAAMAEVERKLAEREAEMKRQKAEKEAEMKAVAEEEKKVAEMNAAAEEAEKEAEMKAAAEEAEKEAEMKAAAEQAEKEATMKAAAEKAKAAEASKSSLSGLGLEDQIQILKSRRDKLMLLAESKIRAKREAEIDKMIADGKAADSDEVTTALEELNNSIHSSNEKLTARYRRKIEKLKQAFEARSKKENNAEK